MKENEREKEVVVGLVIGNRRDDEIYNFNVFSFFFLSLYYIYAHVAIGSSQAATNFTTPFYSFFFLFFLG